MRQPSGGFNNTALSQVFSRTVARYSATTSGPSTPMSNGDHNLVSTAPPTPSSGTSSQPTSRVGQQSAAQSAAWGCSESPPPPSLSACGGAENDITLAVAVGRNQNCQETARSPEVSSSITSSPMNSWSHGMNLTETFMAWRRIRRNQWCGGNRNLRGRPSM